MSDISSVQRNPWLGLPKSQPYILTKDLRKLSLHGLTPEKLGWKTKLLPVPYLGNLKKAKIIVLCLNPGYNRKLDNRAYFKDKYYFQENLKSLKFTSHTPFYCLDTKFDYSGGYIWWTRLLKSLIKDFGLRSLSKKLMCLQYIGYHSTTFRKPPCILPSQKFTFCLLKQAMKENKTIEDLVNFVTHVDNASYPNAEKYFRDRRL